MRVRARAALTFALAVLLLGLQPLAALAAPANDDFDDATMITVLPFDDLLDTSDATEAPDDPDCAGAGPTVWYALTLGADTFVEFNTFGSDYDTTLSAYLGERGDLGQIACNDDAGGGVQSRIRFTADAGETYYIMVGAFASGPGGQLVLNAFETEPPVPVEPVDITLTVNPTGRFDARSGNAYVSGTVTCSTPAYVSLWGDLIQRAGRANIYGSFSDSFLCEGVTPFESSTDWTTGRFAGGRAEVHVAVEGCPIDFDWDDYDEWPCDYDEVGRTIQLRGGLSR
jgi:hypothetical protein